jgi:hypothetical protein
MSAAISPLRKLVAKAGGTPPLPPERVALGLAISAHVELQAERAATAASMQIASENVWAARTRLDAAPELLEQAKVNTANYLAGIPRGETRTPPQTIREARDAAVDAQDDLDAAKVAKDALNERMERLDLQAYKLKDAMEKAAFAVIGAEAADRARAMAADLMRLQQEMYSTGQALAWLTATAKVLPVIEQHGGNFGKVADDAIRRAIGRLEIRPAEWDTHNRPQTLGDASAPWRAALAALQADPAAPLPVVPAL